MLIIYNLSDELAFMLGARKRMTWKTPMTSVFTYPTLFCYYNEKNEILFLSGRSYECEKPFFGSISEKIYNNYLLESEMTDQYAIPLMMNSCMKLLTQSEITFLINVSQHVKNYLVHPIISFQHSAQYDTENRYKSVVIVIDNNNKVLMLSKEDKMCLPGGRESVYDLCNPATTALRELYEETGIIAFKHKLLFVGIDYTYKGKPVHIFMLRIDEIKYDDIILSDEHQSCLLVDFSQLRDEYSINQELLSDRTKSFIDTYVSIL